VIESPVRQTFRVKTLKASSAVVATGNTGTSVKIPDALNAMGFVVDVTAAGTAAADTTNIYVQTKLDGTNWVDIYRATEIAGNGGAKRYIAKVTGALATAGFENGAALGEAAVRNMLGDEYRVRWVVVDDTDPSCTFSVTAIPM